MTPDATAASLDGNTRYSKTTLFFVFHLHLFGSLMMLQNVADSLFFSTVGVEHLPTIRFVMAAVMLPMTLVYDRISARDPENRTFAPLILIFALTVLALALVRDTIDPRLGAFALMVASPVAQTFLLAEFWNFANRYFTIRESKRTFPQLFAAASLGGVAAGFATSSLASLTPTENLLYVWFALTLLGLTILRAIRRGTRPVQSADPAAQLEAAAQASAARRRRRAAAAPGILRRLRDGLLAQPLVTGIIGLSFLGNVALFLAEYAWYDVFSTAHPDTDDLTEFLGFWSAVSSAINFAISIFVLPRLAALIGVRNLTLAQPLFAVAVFVSLIISPVLAVAVVSFLTVQSRNVVEETNEKFLYKGLAPEVAQVVRGRSEGMVKPLAAAFAALALFLFGTRTSPLVDALGLTPGTLAVSVCGLVLGVGYIATALVARYAYPRAIVERIRTRSFDPDADASDGILDGSRESHAVLREQLRSHDAEIVRFAADYLHGVDPDLAVALVLERLGEVSAPADATSGPVPGDATTAALTSHAARRFEPDSPRSLADEAVALSSELAALSDDEPGADGDPVRDPIAASLRAELFALLAQWAPSLRPEVLQPAVEPWLGHADADLRASALRVWAALPDAPIEPVVAALDDGSADVRREAIAALCTHWDLMHVARGAERLVALMKSPEESSRLGAVVVLGRLSDRRHLRMLTPLLDDASAAVRLRAARVLAERIDETCVFLVDELVARLESQRDPAVRLHLIDALLQVAAPEASRAVLESGEGMPERLRRRSARFLANHAEANATLLEQTLATPSRRHGERMLAAQALTLGGRRFRGFLGDRARQELVEAYQTLRDGWQLERLLTTTADSAQQDALRLLMLALDDRRREALEIVIEIVGFASQHPDFDTIRTYCFSSDPVARAYAIEALENLADRTLFELLLPFLTHDPNDEMALALGPLGAQLGLAEQDDDVVARRVDDPHPWVRACALFAAARLGHEATARAASAYVCDADPLVRETAAWALPMSEQQAS